MYPDVVSVYMHGDDIYYFLIACGILAAIVIGVCIWFWWHNLRQLPGVPIELEENPYDYYDERTVESTSLHSGNRAAVEEDVAVATAAAMGDSPKAEELIDEAAKFESPKDEVAKVKELKDESAKVETPKVEELKDEADKIESLESEELKSEEVKVQTATNKEPMSCKAANNHPTNAEISSNFVQRRAFP